MTALQTLQLRQSSIRESLNKLLGIESRTEDQDAELVKLTAERGHRAGDPRRACRQS